MNRIWDNKQLLKVLREKYVSVQRKKGIKFEETKMFWKSKKSKLIKNKQAIQNKSINYPAYFTSSIHTYENGHLNWCQAYQTMCHMQSSALMSVKDIKKDESFQCSPEEAYAIYKTYIADNLMNEMQNMNITEIADLGCGTGEITQMLAVNYPQAFITGVDMSPNYLSIGIYKYSESMNMQWLHANIEYTEIDQESFDVVVISYVFHEMIPEAIQGTIHEAYRILKPNGKVIVVDMDPEKIPSFPSTIDISEPHLKLYRTVNILDFFRNAGFIKYERKHMHQMSSLFVGIKP